ncbi:MAG: bifunctional phosphoribosylaminoimidazolecarboxamide formyltransferase/IMP cyclohydrolase [Verrucomicrobiota bacterium]
MKIKRALISVSDKSGLDVFAGKLAAQGVEILSTGGTSAFLKENGIEVIDVSDFTEAPELFEGRVKTLHPRIHGGLLFRRELEEDVADAEKHGIKPIDLLVVNLYPFEETVAKEGVTLEEAIENIDIGGPSLLRGAAKNYKSVTVVADPSDYDGIIEEMENDGGGTSLKTRERLAIKVYQRTAEYDRAIAEYLNQEQETESSFSISFPLCAELRYGDNPHQEASLYGRFNDYFTKLQGKDLSYTNVLDIGAAAELVSEFRRPTVGILKHTNPCGVGCADGEETIREAWEKAFETDRQAPFGGVIVMNRPMTESLARVVSEIFTDVIIAPDFDSEARTILQKKKNLRLMKVANEFFTKGLQGKVIRSAPGGVLVMDGDWKTLGLDGIEKKVQTKRPPSADEIEAMRFGWRVVRHVRSNAIVFSGSDRTLGIGAGQMSRVDSCRIAVWKAEFAGLSLKGSAVASDAMFPFADGLVSAAEAGASACIQPGGSVRDEEVIAAADEHDLAMVFTGNRHFLH